MYGAWRRYVVVARCESEEGITWRDAVWRMPIYLLFVLHELPAPCLFEEIGKSGLYGLKFAAWLAYNVTIGRFLLQDIN